MIASKYFVIKSNWVLYSILILVYLFYTYIYDQFIQTDDIIIHSLSDTYSKDIILQAIGLKRKWEFLGYLVIPLIILIRTTIIAVLIQGTLYIQSSLTREYSFKKVWKITIVAEWAFVLMLIFKFFWFAYYNTSYSLDELSDFSPFSLYSLIEHSDKISSWFIYPLKTINLFEILYITLLIWGCKRYLEFTFLKSAEVILYSYILPLVIWMFLVMYLLLNIS